MIAATRTQKLFFAFHLFWVFLLGGSLVYTYAAQRDLPSRVTSVEQKLEDQSLDYERRLGKIDGLQKDIEDLKLSTETRLEGLDRQNADNSWLLKLIVAAMATQILETAYSYFRKGNRSDPPEDD